MVPSVEEMGQLVRKLKGVQGLEGHQRDWLLWELVRTQSTLLVWAQEHCMLLDGLSSNVLYMAEEMMNWPVPQEVVNEVTMESRSWLEAFVDRLQLSPLHKDLMQMAWKSLEFKFGLEGNGEESEEE
ncbi:hypothetical protein C0992_012096 [Termitomyces sp. T32_za158]|nr:hypothetical protein C0992_012096 [Termitomyces sp. T32_za158]